MKMKSLALMLLTAGAVFAQVSIGIRIGAPPPPRVIRVEPRSPGPEYLWVAGYWYPVSNRYRWHEGYWTRPPFGGARWVGPRYEGERYFEGYWDGDHQLRHDHRWDKGRKHYRDWDRDRR